MCIGMKSFLLLVELRPQTHTLWSWVFACLQRVD